MKKNLLLLLIIFLFSSLRAFSQQNVGIGTNAPNSNSILDLTVPNPTLSPQGFLLPRLTTAQRLAISPSGTEKSLMVYDTLESNKCRFH